jgi:hypothetical protein
MKNGVFWDDTPCGSLRTDVSEELRTSEEMPNTWYFFAACVGC